MFLFVLLWTCVHVVVGSECCDGYYDIYRNWKDPQWCDEYCCGSSAVKLFCCESLLLQAPSDDRSDFCGLWWSHNVWAPIVTALVSLGILIGCCICCYKCCGAKNRTTVFVNNPGMGGPNITTSVVSSHTSTGYNYNQPPHY